VIDNVPERLEDGGGARARSSINFDEESVLERI
jgi:hypothetical protein